MVRHDFLGTFGGLQVYSDPNALAETTVRNFPESRNRSARIHKKLVKRFGGVFRKEPAIFRIGNRLVAHPTRYAELMAQLRSVPTT